MSKLNSTWLAILPLLSLVIVFISVPVSAFDGRKGDIVNVTSDEVINDDLYIAGREIIVDGTVNGDLWVAGRIVTIGGTVNGNITAAGDSVNISGETSRTVRAAGKDLDISGNVGGDVLAAGNSVNVITTAKIMGDLICGARTLRIDGVVEDDMKAGAEEVTISNGIMNGNVDVHVRRLNIMPSAIIQGDLTYTCEQTANIRPGAQIAGTTTHKLPEIREKPFPFNFFSSFWSKFLGFVMILIIGLVIVLIVPERLKEVAHSMLAKPGMSAGWGAVILFGTPIAVIILLVSVVGISLGLIALVLYFIALYLSQIPVGLFIGRWIIKHFRELNSKAITFGALALGLLILRILRLIPYIGGLIGLASLLFGLGAVVVLGRNRAIEARKAASENISEAEST